MPRYGRKNGTSKNAGRKATTYTAVMPDGSTVKKRSYQITTPTAYLGIYQHDGEWFTSGIAATPQKWPGQTFIRAVKTQ